ncbi:MAG: hypothetical protein U0231_00420 [Nitrospiraceae bacterium]
MPWVRLHTTKAYYDMAFILEQYPHARSTFNFTPSLLLQLEEFSTGRVQAFLEYAQRPATDLTSTEKAFLIRHFFSANWATMVRPFRAITSCWSNAARTFRGGTWIASPRRFPRRTSSTFRSGTIWPGSGTAA